MKGIKQCSYIITSLLIISIASLFFLKTAYADQSSQVILNNNNSSQSASFQTINSALQYASAQNWNNITLQLSNTTFNEDVTVATGSAVTIVGQGSSSTEISGNFVFNDASYIQFENLAIKAASITSGKATEVTMSNSTLSASGPLSFGSVDTIQLENVSGNPSLITTGNATDMTLSNSTFSNATNLSFGDAGTIHLDNVSGNPSAISTGNDANVTIANSAFSVSGNLSFGPVGTVTITNSTLTTGNLIFGEASGTTITGSTIKTQSLVIGADDSYTENDSTVSEVGGITSLGGNDKIELDNYSNLNLGCSIVITPGPPDGDAVYDFIINNSILREPPNTLLQAFNIQTEFAVSCVNDQSCLVGGTSVCDSNSQIPPDYQESHSTSSTSNYSPSNGEPINMIGGNYLAKRQEFKVPGRDLPVNFYLSYNSDAASQSGVLGYGWTHSYLVSATPIASGSGGVLINNEDGRMDLYTPDGSGGFTPPPDIHDTLTATASGYILTRKNHVVYNFTTSGQLKNIVSPNGNTQTLSYNAHNELATLTDTVGRVFTFMYDTNGHLTQLTDPSGRSVKYTYDANGNMVTATDAAGDVTTYRYDANHQITGIADPRGNTAVTNTYDAQGRVISQTNALGKTIKLSYSSGQTVFTDPKGNLTTYFYDDQLRLTKLQNANGGITVYTYDSNDNQNSITDPKGNETNMAYDSNGNLTQITNASGSATTFTYDGRNNLTSQTDPLGHVKGYSYDAHSNLLQKTDPEGNKTIFTYDAFGDLISETDPLGHTTSLAYDNQSNISGITNPLGNITKISYDAIGRPVSTIDASGHTSQYVYDALDRLIQTKDALGNTATYAFDPDGNQIKVIDPNKHAASYIYNAANELTSVIDALGHTTSYTYDDDGNLASTADANNHITSYSYDVLNRLVTSSNPLNQKTVRIYDADNNLISSTDSNGHTTTSVYDPLNELTAINYADKTSVFYTYDSDGNRSEMDDSTGKTAYSYDVLGNLTVVTSPGNKTVFYTYDADSNQSSMTYPDGHTEKYSYNGANQMVSAEDWNSRTTTYAYTPTGNVKQVMYPNGADITYAYDITNKLTNVTDTPKLGPGTSYSYALDADGNRTSVDQSLDVSGVNNNVLQNILSSLPNLGNLYQNITSNGQFSFSNPSTTTFYTYDALNRLMKVKGLAVNQSFTYDPAGNRLTQTNNNQTTNYSYNAGDELQKAGNISYAYDANGNRTQENNNGLLTNYVYNDANELSSVLNHNIVVDKYLYDGDGNRVETTANNITTDDTWNVNASLPQLLSQTALNRTTDYQYGNNLISSDNSQPNSENYYEYDGLGSVVGQTNTQGLPVSSYAYDVYGNPEFGAQAIGQPLQNPFGFAEQQQDPTGLIYMRARYYDPNTGTFISHDPYPASLNNPTTINRYAYVQDNPVNLTDPTGLCSINPFSSSSCLESVHNVVKSSVNKTINYVANNAGTITSLTVGAATGIACTLGTAGIGAIACGALAGLVTQEATEFVTGDLSYKNLVIGTALGFVGGAFPTTTSLINDVVNIGGNTVLDILTSGSQQVSTGDLPPQMASQNNTSSICQ